MRGMWWERKKGEKQAGRMLGEAPVGSQLVMRGREAAKVEKSLV